jgi:GntR family transcriptional regulator, vanillate catabolism transcriptional regulator
MLDRAQQILDAIDRVLAAPTLDEERLGDYIFLNGRFHQTVGEMAGSRLLARESARVAGLPFASPSAFVGVQARTRQSRDMLVVAQDQHRQVLVAIERGEGARAEALMREHAKLAQRNLQTVLMTDLSTGRQGDGADGLSTARLFSHGLVRP